MLLAAGRGERMRPLTDRLPKALLEVGGVPLIERHLEMLAAVGVSTAVVNLGWQGERIVERVGSGGRFGLQVVYSPEYEQVLETGGGIQRALPLLGETPFWSVNADVYTDFAVSAPLLEDGCLGHLILVPTPSHKASGDFDLIEGRVARSAHPELTFSGIAVYSPAFFDGLGAGRYSLAPLLFEAADRGWLSGSVYEGTWEDVGTPERLRRLNDRLG